MFSTLGQTLKRWIIDSRTIASLAPDAAKLLPAVPRFLGYIPQRFKVYGQTMAREPANYLRQIRKRMYESVSAVLMEIQADLAPEPALDPIVGKVKDFASLVQTAQHEGVPLWQCSSTGSTYVNQKEEARQAFKEIAERLIQTTSARGPVPLKKG